MIHRRMMSFALVSLIGAGLGGCDAESAGEDARAASQAELVAARFVALHRSGWATGEWDEYLDLIGDDFEFWMPVGDLRGKNTGKPAWEAYVRGATENGTRLTISEPPAIASAGDERFAFHATSQGVLYGEVPFQTTIAVFFTIRGGKVVEFREFFGDLNPELLALAAPPP